MSARKSEETGKNRALTGERQKYKRRARQISMLATSEMFGSLPLNPENDWVKFGMIISCGEFEDRYAGIFKSRNGRPACSARMALGALLIKERNRFSDEEVVKHLAMNPRQRWQTNDLWK